MSGASLDTHTPAARRIANRAPATYRPERSRGASRLTAPPTTFVTPGTRAEPRREPEAPGMGAATARPERAISPYAAARTATTPDPDVWLIALPTSAGASRSLEGAGRAGAIRVSRPYGHLRSVRPVTLDPYFAGEPPTTTATPRTRRARTTTGSLGSATAHAATMLPAPRPTPQVVSAVEVETDAGIFRVERADSVLSHADMAWALAHLESGEPDSVVALPRRQLALLLTLLPTPEDPNQPELDPNWGWAHRLRGPWERGPLHMRGRLGRLIAFDPDASSRGMHRACFELLGSEEVVWAVGVPCFHSGSVYELTPLGKGLHPSRWLTWPLAKGRKRANDPERPQWEIARVVFRVGAPRWPLAGVVEPVGPMGVAG